MFINIPENFASTSRELLYEYQSSSSSDIKFTITKAETDELLGVKKLYNVSEAVINIAPLVRNIAYPIPQRTTTSFSIPDHTSVGINVTCQEVEAEVRYFTAAKATPQQYSVMTTLPLKRSIAPGEQENILIHAPQGTLIAAVISRYLNSEIISSQYLTKSMTDSGVMILNLVAADQEEGDSLRVMIYCNNDAIETLDFAITSQNQYAYRLAWVGSAGSIEHYTFPKVTQRKAMEDGSHEVTIVSDYETQRCIDALAEIISSTKVWRVTNDEYLEVEVSTSELVVYREGKMSLIELNIVEND